MKRINTIDLYVDGNDPSTGVALPAEGNNVIVKAVLIDNADADTLQVELPLSDAEGELEGGARVYGSTAPMSPQMWEAVRQKWVDAYGTEPTREELLVYCCLLADTGDVPLAMPAGINMSDLTVVSGVHSGVGAAIFPIEGYAQLLVAVAANASSQKTRAGQNATRARATLTLISE